MYPNPTTFPDTQSSLFIQGPAGQLQVKVAHAQTQAKIHPVTVICCHPHPLHGGTMENKVVTTLFRSFKDMGANVVRFNYRGVGESEGEYANAIGETEDLMAIIRWVNEVLPEGEIWLAGFSFGSYVTTRAASMADVKQLITVAPAVHHFEFTKLKQPDCPWLIIIGDADDVVSADAVKEYVNELEKQVKLINLENAGHFFHGRLLEIKDILRAEYQALLS